MILHICLLATLFSLLAKWLWKIMRMPSLHVDLNMFCFYTSVKHMSVKLWEEIFLSPFSNSLADNDCYNTTPTEKLTSFCFKSSLNAFLCGPAYRQHFWMHLLKEDRWSSLHSLDVTDHCLCIPRDCLIFSIFRQIHIYWLHFCSSCHVDIGPADKTIMIIIMI